MQLEKRLGDADFLLKLTSIGAVATIIHQGVQWGDTVLSNLDRYAAAGAPFAALILKSLNITQPQEIQNTPKDSALRWLVSVGIAVVVVEHFGEIVTASGKILGFAQEMLKA